MTGCESHNIHTLPDIEIYGGDNRPWEVILIRDDGSAFSVDSLSQYTATLTFTPLKVTSGIGNNAVTIDPILTKIGEFNTTLNNGVTVLFSFDEDDTKQLRGKYLYQVEIRYNAAHEGKEIRDLRICQGHIYIKQNINR